jgi:hypothetical protein
MILRTRHDIIGKSRRRKCIYWEMESFSAARETEPPPQRGPRRVGDLQCAGDHFERGSRASRRPSPSTLNDSTVMKMAMPG